MPLPSPQVAPWAIPDPTPLTPAPIWERLALENPLPLTLALVVVAAALWYALRDKPRRQVHALTSTLAALALGLLLLGHFVTTPREAMRHNAFALVRAVAAGDAPAAQACLDPEAKLFSSDARDGQDLDTITQRIQSEFGPGGRLRLKDYAVLELQAAQETPSRGRVQIKVRGTLEASGVPGVSWWRLDYILNPGGTWRVSGIQPLSFPGLSW